MNRWACKLGTILMVSGAICVPQCRSQAAVPEPVTFLTPQNRSIVHPGDTVSFKVSVPPGTTLLNGMDLIGPLGFSNESREAPPFDFTMTIPVKDPPSDRLIGVHPVSAFGAANGREGYDLGNVNIDVEPEEMPVKLVAYGQSATGGDTRPFNLLFLRAGSDENIGIDASFPGGAKLDVTHSSYLSVQSSDTRVVRIDTDEKIVTSVGPGTATIIATYSMGVESMRILIPVTVEVPKTGVIPDPLTLDFGDQAVGTTSPASSVTLTNQSDSSVTIFKIDIRGDYDFNESDNCTVAPLAPGGTCTITVTFSPHRVGTVTNARIDLPNSYDQSSSVDLSGNGT
jgi:hypothetical protein